MADVTAPNLVSISISDSFVNIDGGEDGFVVTARFTDDASGIFDGEFADGSGGSPPQLVFVSPSGQIVFGVFDILNPVSGNRKDGVYRAPVKLSEFAEAGTWTVQSLLLNDEAGNEKFLDPTNSALVAGLSFQVQNANSDSAVPTLVSISLNKAQVNVASGETTLLVTARFKDNLSGIFDGEFADGLGGSPPQLMFVSPSGQIVFGVFDILNPVSGNRKDGVYRASVTLSEFAEAGTWEVQSLLLNDEAGNVTVLDPTNSALIAGLTFKVVNTISDKKPPDLLSLDLGSPSLDSSGRPNFLVTAHFTDDASGIFDGEFADGLGGSPPQIRFVSSTGQTVTGMFDILHPVSGDRLDGVFSAPVTLSPFSETGTWTIEYLLLNDEAGNQRFLTPDTNPEILGSTIYIGSDLPDTIVGTSDTDTIYGFDGNDRLTGLAGDDTLVGGDGDDKVNAGGGDDTIVGGSGAGDDKYIGGAGTDRVVYTSATKKVVVNLKQGKAKGAEIGKDKLKSIESVLGGQTNDVIKGDKGKNVLDGHTGKDKLTGSGGKDAFAFSTELANSNVDKIKDFSPRADTIYLDNAVFVGLSEGVLKAKAFKIGKQASDKNDRIIYDKKSGDLLFDENGSKKGGEQLFAKIDSGLKITHDDFLVF